MVRTNRSIRAPALRTSARLSAAATPSTRPVVEPPRWAAPTPLFRPASSDEDEDPDTPAVEEQREEQAGGEGLEAEAEAEAEEALHDPGEVLEDFREEIKEMSEIDREHNAVLRYKFGQCWDEMKNRLL